MLESASFILIAKASLSGALESSSPSPVKGGRSPHWPGMVFKFTDDTGADSLTISQDGLDPNCFIGPAKSIRFTFGTVRG